MKISATLDRWQIEAALVHWLDTFNPIAYHEVLDELLGLDLARLEGWHQVSQTIELGVRLGGYEFRPHPHKGEVARKLAELARRLHARSEAKKAGVSEADFAPYYEKWRHGGWYVGNIRYPNGACGCVSNNYADKKWRIVTEGGKYERLEDYPSYATRDAAARAEYRMVEALKAHG